MCVCAGGRGRDPEATPSSACWLPPDPRPLQGRQTPQLLPAMALALLGNQAEHWRSRLGLEVVSWSPRTRAVCSPFSHFLASTLHVLDSSRKREVLSPPKGGVGTQAISLPDPTSTPLTIRKKL